MIVNLNLRLHTKITLKRIHEHIFSEFTIGINNYQIVFFMMSAKKCNFGVVWETPKTLNCGEHYIMWRGGIQ